MKPLPNIGSGVKLKIQALTKLGQRASSYECNARIQQWIGRAGYEAGLLLRSLRDKAEQWWYFLNHPEVPPDNNLAERALTGMPPWGIAAPSRDQT